MISKLIEIKKKRYEIIPEYKRIYSLDIAIDLKTLDFHDRSYLLTDESFIEAEQIFNKVVKFDFHNSSSPFLQRHCITRKSIIHAKTKK